MALSEPAVKDSTVTPDYALYCGDSCEALQAFKDQSIHMSLYSPPFGGLYQYSSSERDISNSLDYPTFLEHYGFIVRELARITMPGRISAVHAMDVPREGANICGSIDFPGDVIRLHEQHGFEYVNRICIWKDPFKVRLRTMARHLAHKTIVQDSTLCSVASADWLLQFRRKGTNPVPVAHPTGFHRYVGAREVPAHLHQYRGWTGSQIENRYSHWIWRNYASCFWDDIRIDRVLPYKESKEPEDEKHVHPLQLDVIERAVQMWTNPGETVLTPFMGVGSEVYGAVLSGRKGIGIELKESYYRQAVRNVEAAKHASTTGGQRNFIDEMEAKASSVDDADPAELTGAME